MKKLTVVLLTVAMMLLGAVNVFAQQTPAYAGSPTALKAGRAAASDYAGWLLQAYSAVSASSASMSVTQNGTYNTQQFPSLVKVGNGRTINPIAITVRLSIGTGSTQETVTPTAISCTNNLCSFTATFVNAHSAGELIQSGSFGLDEAMNDLTANGGGTVVVGSDWAGLDSTISAAIPFGNITIEDMRKTPQYWNPLPTVTALLAAPTVLAGQVACDATHQFCSDTSVAGSASWSGTVFGCYTLVDINGNESPCSATNSYTSVVSKAIDMGVSFTARTDNIVGWKPYLSVSGGSYALAYSVPLLTQPTVLLAVPVSAGVCTLTTLETTTPACAIANSKYGQSGSTTGVNALFLGGMQFTGYPVVTNTLAPEIGSVSALAHNPNHEAHATYAYVPGNRIGFPGVQAQRIVFPITAAAQTTIGEVVGTIPLPSNFMNFIGRTIEVCGTIAKTSTVADTIDEIQVWWDAEGSNVTAGTPVQLSSIKTTEATALAAAANFQFCQQLTTTVSSTTTTGGSIAPGLGWSTVTQTSAGANPSVGSSATSGTAVGSLNLALPAHLTIELKHTTGTDGAGVTLYGATVRVIN